MPRPPGRLSQDARARYGVSGSRPWSAQLEQCEAACRRDVESIAASCRALCHKFTDNDFPPTARSLFVNGGRPAPTAKMPAEVTWLRAGDLCPEAGAAPLEVSEVLTIALVPDSGRDLLHGFAALGVVDQASAKVHGSYEAVQRSTELEALEDLTGGAVRRLGRQELATGEDLALFLEARQRLGCLHLLLRRSERRGEEHASGLLAGLGYPALEAELGGARLGNPWPRGGFRGAGATAPPGAFFMDADELLKHFTDVLEVRLPPGSWLSTTVTLSTERPSYPLVSSKHVAQCMVIASQPDRRWGRQDSYLNGIGLRVYRCRVRAPDPEQQGARQDPNANPFEPLELLRKRPLGKSHSVSLDFLLEPYALYVVTLDSQYRCPRCVVRFACSADVQLRELSAQEAEHFLRAQPDAEPAPDVGSSFASLTRSPSEISGYGDYGASVCGRGEVIQCGRACGSRVRREAQPWWKFGCG